MVCCATNNAQQRRRWEPCMPLEHAYKAIVATCQAASLPGGQVFSDRGRLTLFWPDILYSALESGRLSFRVSCCDMNARLPKKRQNKNLNISTFRSGRTDEDLLTQAKLMARNKTSNCFPPI